MYLLEQSPYCDILSLSLRQDGSSYANISHIHAFDNCSLLLFPLIIIGVMRTAVGSMCARSMRVGLANFFSAAGAATAAASAAIAALCRARVCAHSIAILSNS